MKPIAWLSMVVGTLASLTVLERGSTARRSVKVPPTSMPTVRKRGAMASRLLGARASGPLMSGPEARAP